MMVLKTMDKVSFNITDEEADLVVEAIQNGMKFIKIKRAMIASSNISGIYPNEVVEKNKGRLHDGTKVIKKFGTWVDADNTDVRLDTTYYPEIAKDDVLSEEQWEKRKNQKQLS